MTMVETERARHRLTGKQLKFYVEAVTAGYERFGDRPYVLLANGKYPDDHTRLDLDQCYELLALMNRAIDILKEDTTNG